MCRKKWTFVLAVLACLLLVSVVWAQTSPSFDLSWHVVAGGGRDMASANHAVRGTVGQLAIGPAQSTGHAVGSGYWYGIGGLEELFEIYLPVVLKSVGL